MITTKFLLLTCLCLNAKAQNFKHFPAVGGGGAPRGPPRETVAPRAPQRVTRPKDVRQKELEQINEVEQFFAQPEKVERKRNRGRGSLSRSRTSIQNTQAPSNTQERRRGNLPRRRPQPPIPEENQSIATPITSERPTTRRPPPSRQFTPSFSLEDEQQPRREQGQSLGQALGQIFNQGSITEIPRFSSLQTQPPRTTQPPRRKVPAPTRPPPTQPASIPFVFLPNTQNFQDVNTFPENQNQGFQRDSFQSFQASLEKSQPRTETFQSFQATPDISQSRIEPFQSPRDNTFQSFQATPREENLQSFQAPPPRQQTAPRLRQPVQKARTPTTVPRVPIPAQRTSIPTPRAPQRVPKDFGHSMFDSTSLFSSDLTIPKNSGDGVYFSYSALLE